MNHVKKVYILLSVVSIGLCNIIYQGVFHHLATDGHHHSEYSITWAPNAYMVFFLWAFSNCIPKKIIISLLFMTIIGFNLLYFSSQNYPVGMGTYGTSIIMYAVNNTIFIFGFFYLLKFWQLHFFEGNKNYVISYVVLHVGGAICTLIASFSIVIFPSASLVLVYQLFSANLMAFTFFTSYLFLSDMLIPNDKNTKLFQFSLLVLLSSMVFYIVNIHFHDLSKETFALILMASFIFLFIRTSIYLKIMIVSLVSALFAAVNVALSLSLYDFILFYGICVSTSIILIMRRKEIEFINELQDNLEALEKSRLMDPLTGVLNREGLINALKENVLCKKDCLVAYADLDKFKEINDVMGHSSGDLVLRIVATRIRAALGQNPVVARLGGDEFGFIITGDKSYTLDLCQNIIDKVKNPVIVSGVELSIGISIGVCFYPNQETVLDFILDKADIAMFVAKRTKAKSPVCFERHMDHRKKHEKISWSRTFNVEDILKNSYAVFQPMHDIENGKVTSFEALLRHPTIGTIDIINWAEEYGYMNEIFEMMVISALDIIRTTNIPVTVNISPSQLIFNGDMIESFLAEIIHDNGLSPYSINIEVTESVPILDQELFIDVVGRIKALGIRIYLDDFGTGYAFFSTLSIGTFDAIKIDRKLVREIHEFQSTQRLLSSIISYASATGIMIIAEGVETNAELEILKALGMRYIQGFYFSKPLKKLQVLSYLSVEKSQNDNVVSIKNTKGPYIYLN
ncbi:putative bifunctional diguanylate cyclase/phosphodiesterase [Aeromonas sp. PI_26]|uniref:putative bifunctional diguanylate cyclase/phosphodiesterase n=1 Tax=unclassified Aeromonas TaxID=257493 RepID=UPI0022EA5525|nr:EAL domain-containing protein [Aeromonas sp. PI_26]MDA3318747.1 EAL domain-containing protein [Aeromonas sp. PI_26]